VADQCTQELEGNAQLKPEVATTWSVGLTLTPSDLRGFTASIDYFHIHLTGEIGAIPYGAIVKGCIYDDIKLFCDQFDRSSTGAITGATVANKGYVVQQDFNLGTAILSGIDLLLNDRWELPRGFGHFITAFNGSWVQHNTNSPYPGASTYDCAGLFGATCESGSVNPRWRHNMRLSWDTPWNVLFSLQWRFIGPTSFDNNSSNLSLANVEDAEYNPYFARIPGYSYIDLSTVWHVNQHLELRAGVNNVLDKDPPVLPEGDISGTAGGANSFQTYDLLGRQLFVAFTTKF
jgi:iron complex outermembrane receptor protein